jgi:hypothetical protein
MKPKSYKQNKNQFVGNTVINFGTRAIYKANFSRAISLPKTALANLGIDTGLVNVDLVQENNSKYLRLVPVGGKRN